MSIGSETGENRKDAKNAKSAEKSKGEQKEKGNTNLFAYPFSNFLCVLCVLCASVVQSASTSVGRRTCQSVARS
jgi:hypothetical protein